MKIDSTPFNTSSLYLYREKATIHLDAEEPCEGQVSKKAEKQSCYSILYCSVARHRGTNSAFPYNSFDPELV